MNQFNLIDSPWIPVRTLDGTNQLVGLEELFCRAAALADLDCAPHDRISLLRLLVCLTQAALGAPNTPDDWEDFGQDFSRRIIAYLRRPDIHPHFNLFGDGPRFLQDTNIAQNEKNQQRSSWICFGFSTGNNHTLFDHAGSMPEERPRQLTPHQLALALLAFQNFSPPVGQHTGYGHCAEKNSLHVLLVCSNLQETILLNCLDRETIAENYPAGLGCPLWESSPFHEKLCRSYLYRLVPCHRKLLLDSGCAWLWKEQPGFQYPLFSGANGTQIREPSQVIRSTKTNRDLLPCDYHKSVWRDLHRISVNKATEDGFSGPLVVFSHAQQIEKMGEVPLFCGGLVFENTASLVSAIESTSTVPSALFTRHGRTLFEMGVHYATSHAKNLHDAVKKYGAVLKNQSPQTKSAQQHYWNTLELQVQTLLEMVPGAETRTESFGEGQDPWTQAVRQAALRAYERTCPRQTPRQIQAYAAGLKVLHAMKKAPKKSTTTAPAP